MEGVICDGCGSHSKGIQMFSEFSHIAPCTVKDSDGVPRASVEPIFAKFRELCFACYKMAARKYVAETRAPKE